MCYSALSKLVLNQKKKKKTRGKNMYEYEFHIQPQKIQKENSCNFQSLETSKVTDSSLIIL